MDWIEQNGCDVVVEWYFVRAWGGRSKVGSVLVDSVNEDCMGVLCVQYGWSWS